MTDNRTYHIIGAGCAGLYAAKLLKEQDPLSSIVIYEAAEKIGGRCGSFYDQDFSCYCDNATHVILSSNKRAKKILGKQFFVHGLSFWDVCKQNFIPLRKCLKEICLAIFNTFSPSFRSKLFVLRKLFPFFTLKAYFSCGNLQDNLCAPLLCFADDIKYGYVWQGVHHDNSCVTQLIFNRQTIDVSSKDIVISAIDSYHYDQLFGGYSFDYNPICNIFYRTSTSLTFPRDVKILGLTNGLGHWIFSSSDYTAVTLSAVEDPPDPRLLWNEICAIRHYNSAFLPLWKMRTFAKATIRQDSLNNRKRPSSCRTCYKNMFICGDWTMKNQPCCIETALNSAVRISKCLRKFRLQKIGRQ